MTVQPPERTRPHGSDARQPSDAPRLANTRQPSAAAKARSTVHSSTRDRSRQSATDAHYGTGTQGLTNARTRIVGDRQGVSADVVILLVRIWRRITAVLRRWGAVASGVVTPLGWVILALTPIALIVGYTLGWLELVAVGFALVVLLCLAALYAVGRNAFTVTLDLPHSRVSVGDEASGRVTITNPTRRRVLGVTVEIPIGPGLAEISLPGMRGGDSVEETFQVPTYRRGVIPVGPVRTVRGDPIGVVRRELEWTGVTELFVHPRTIGIPSTSTGLIRDLEGNPTRDLSASDISFHALREYVPGDDRRHIHWKSSARAGQYMVRQFEETRRSHIVIALSLANADFATEEEFELGVSVAASLGVRAIRDAREVSVVVSERTPEFAKRKTLAVRALATLTRVRLLDELALVTYDESALGITDVARVTGEQVAGISVAFLVVGSTTGITQLRAAASAFPAGVEAVAIVCDPETVPGMRRVADLTILTVGYLEDLQQSLAKTVTG
ncbi:uncharacterized protein (DUF58 family) [Frondihabitans sp. PhB188]|uniref:DUF58 domain-containing protein n=1 Tax=Frondihabitans sp. PhB188 TaxID=2485200 RepID=UPI000FAB9426|nr:DUF58 domain-containing protein [Frondihabitans sp. PhB188]ROQ41275.1 uncharacterized protein (DUF58 family) [Frondihabitans sp. PhB188]